jgi:hypothetical protein
MFKKKLVADSRGQNTEHRSQESEKTVIRKTVGSKQLKNLTAYELSAMSRELFAFFCSLNAEPLNIHKNLER